MADLSVRARRSIGRAAIMSVYGTTFQGTENPISQTSLWTNGGPYGPSNMQMTPGLCFGTQIVGAAVPPYCDSIAALTGVPFGPDQWVVGTAFAQNPQNGSATYQEIELWARVTFSGSTIWRGYDTNIRVVTDGSGYCQIGRRNGTVNDTSFAGDVDNTVTGITVVTGDRFAMSVIGTAIKVYKNGTLINSATDATWTSGAPGLGHWFHGTLGAVSDYGWSQWQASDSPLF